jgi:chromosome partitioning protein
MEGLGQIVGVVEQLKAAGAGDRLTLGAIIMTMFDGRTNLSKQVVDEVKKHFPDKVMDAVIPRTVRLSEAPSHGKTIFQYDAQSPGAKAYAALSKEFATKFALR